MSNPLLEKFNTPFQSAPFSKIKTEHFKPAFEKAISWAQKEIDDICSNNEPPTFENTIEKLAFSGMQLDRISSIFFNLNSAETSDEIQKIAQKVSPMLSKFSNDITLNEKLFKRIEQVYLNRSNLNLTTEQTTLLTKKYKNFVRNGANLNATDKKELRSIDTQLAKLKLDFGEHVLAETNDYKLHITDKTDLKGLPKGVVLAAAEEAKNYHKTGWLFTLNYPSYVPFMTYAENRPLRETLAKAYGARAFRNNKNNNEQTILNLVKLRDQRAKLLGYQSFSHFVLEERMAENPENVNSFLNELLEKAKPFAQKELEQLKSLAKKDGISDIQKWDVPFYSEKLKQQLFNIDQEKLKPYFKLENVIEGIFKVANKLYDLNFKEVYNIDKYHKDVKTYEVTNSSEQFIALFYADFFPRKGKRGGAWMTSFKSQFIQHQKNSRPHISIVCNFTKPTEKEPSLLTFNEVTTLFHEFGHALHGMLANTTYPSLSGTSVYWDFVELPSQLLENWCYEKETLSLFAKHYQTNKEIPLEWVKKIKESSNFLEGMQTLRQLSFGILDLGYHTKTPSSFKSVKEFEKSAFKNTQLLPDVTENCMSTAFSHIFQGGYASGYYSYKWAEVLDADAFEYFLDNGIFNKAIASKFKTEILEKGGTDKPMTLYKNFRGEKPTINALLKRAGLKN
ncbi:MAG: M3 family metallopeptidase [Lutibacter sp.]